MSRVEINADGRHVVVEHESTNLSDLSYLIEKAYQTWERTDDKRPATGFSSRGLLTTPSPG